MTEKAEPEPLPSWPDTDIAGYTHDGAAYCCACAEEHSEIDTDRYLNEPETVAHGGWIRTDETWPHSLPCDTCGKIIPVQTAFGDCA